MLINILYSMAHIYHADAIANWFQASQRVKPMQNKNDLLKKKNHSFPLTSCVSQVFQQNTMTPQTSSRRKVIFCPIFSLQVSCRAFGQASGLLIHPGSCAPNGTALPGTPSDRRTGTSQSRPLQDFVGFGSTNILQ